MLRANIAFLTHFRHLLSGSDLLLRCAKVGCLSVYASPRGFLNFTAACLITIDGGFMHFLIL